jgi:L,D-transpeptidase YcbB
MRIRLAPLALILVLLVPGAGLAASLETAIEQVLGRGEVTRGPGGRAIPLEPLRDYYAVRGYRPLWMTEVGASSRGLDLVAALTQAEAHGLDTAEYLHDLPAGWWRARDADDLARTELALSSALLRFARDVRHGRASAAVVDPEIVNARGSVDPVAVLDGAAATRDLHAHLDGLAPSHRQYRALKAALGRLSDHHSEALGLPPVPDGPLLRPGAADARVLYLRANLAARGLGTLPDTEDALRYDRRLADAVRAAQKELGLEPDGLVGPRTRAELNRTITERRRQIVINMERWRWLPDDLGERYVFVNQAGFDLYLQDGDRRVLEMRVIVGRDYRRTPVFSDRIRYLEINPTWTVPPRLARVDILPKLRHDPGYLLENDFHVYASWSASAPRVDPWSVDWHALPRGSFPFRLVQQPGPRNALGRIKFMFPNEYDVYLHDTPQQELFRRAERAFSSGCIRVERPFELAEALLVDAPGWTRERIDRALAGGRTTVVNLPVPVPVHIVYLTAEVHPDGGIQFYPDVYGRDAELAEYLSGES